MKTWLQLRWWLVLDAWYRAPDKLVWWLAWHLPRRVALMTLVRVAGAATTVGTTDEQTTLIDAYSVMYKHWENGVGK